MESQSQKKGFGTGDLRNVHGALMLPKEMIDLHKETPSFELRFKAPEFRLVVKVSSSSLPSSFFHSDYI